VYKHKTNTSSYVIFPDAGGDMSVDKNFGTYPDANLPIQRGKHGTFLFIQ
jgi:hypothetical protein